MEANEKVCPYCAETIKAAAIKCRYCGSDLSDAPPAVVPQPTISAEHQQFRQVLKLQPAEENTQPLNAVRLAPPSPASEHTPTLPRHPRPASQLNGDERIYLQNADVTVSNARAILQGKTYAMANITSVSMFEESANYSGAGCFGVVAFTLLLLAMAISSSSLGVFGGISLVICIAAIASAKSKYYVRIGSSSGEANAIWSHDRAWIESVVSAMNQAIVERG